MTGYVNFPDQVLQNGSPIGGGGASWTKYTFSNTQLSDPGQQGKSVTIVTLPQKSVVTGVIVKHSKAFTGGAITAYNVSIDSNNVGYAAYSPNLDVFQSPADNIFNSNIQQAPIFQSAGDDVVISSSCEGGTLDEATQGSVDVWLKVETLP